MILESFTYAAIAGIFALIVLLMYLGIAELFVRSGKCSRTTAYLILILYCILKVDMDVTNRQSVIMHRIDKIIQKIDTPTKN